LGGFVLVIYPAIDILDSKCVRLYQGKREKVTIYSDKPVEVASHWQEQGAEILHVVDLDGAFEGRPINLEVIKGIVRAVNIPVQVGGGLRSERDVSAVFETGAARVVLGTKLVKDPEFIIKICQKYPGRIAAAIDARGGEVAIEGWAKRTKIKATDLAWQLAEFGVSWLIYTDILADGTQQGPNLWAIEDLAESVSLPIIASGGIASIEDIRQVKMLEPNGVIGVIIGRALYEGNFSLSEAIAAAKW
jgi:phosphoribosylformimino-5-aminoimidazole carboxamide ribotide isomerase